jgi:4-hydroxy-2-oxoheptanedioate aldolase
MRSLRKMLSEKVVLGLNMSFPNPACIESMCRGWDFLWIDGQHGQLGYDAMLQSVRIAEYTGISPIVRVPGHSGESLGPTADMCPAGIMVPMVNSREEAERISRALHFYPRGNRSYGGRRPIDLYGREFFKTEDMIVIAQIETLEAVKNADEIAAVEGIDCLFFGPDDMKLQLQLPINSAVNEVPVLKEAMIKVAAAANRYGKYIGVPATTEGSFRFSVELGYRLLVCGSDSFFLRSGAEAKLAECRKLIGG